MAALAILQTEAGKHPHRVFTYEGRPVFGIIKSVMGYRQTLLRGLENVRGEWNLVTLSWNIKRMFALLPERASRPCRPTNLTNFATTYAPDTYFSFS